MTFSLLTTFCLVFTIIFFCILIYLIKYYFRNFSITFFPLTTFKWMHIPLITMNFNMTSREFLKLKTYLQKQKKVFSPEILEKLEEMEKNINIIETGLKKAETKSKLEL